MNITLDIRQKEVSINEIEARQCIELYRVRLGVGATQFQLEN